MTQILSPGSNCSGVYGMRDGGLLVDSCDYYRAFYHAAKQARHYILLAGWQFDSEVRLLRGREAEEAEGDVRLLPFLDALCDGEPGLEIYLLAWDFSIFFSMEREWFQQYLFNWSTNDRIHFRFDSKHAVGATHHQKLVVIDGAIAFVGGMDICSDRWDDRRHLERNPERRNVDGATYGAYHDIQAYLTGPVVKELVALFEQRWSEGVGERLLLPTAHGDLSRNHPGALPLPAATVAVSRTQARNLQVHQGAVQEIRRLFIDAIMAADRLIYLENQYFSSQALYAALVARMTATHRPRLQIVIILPDRLPFTEELFIGVPQMRMLRALEATAAATGHAFGVYSSVCKNGGERKMTFIHSKLLLVDDRFLTVGSANATNRSMGLDTELNVSWEAEAPGEGALGAAIRRVRGSLLAEHAGMGEMASRLFERMEGLVEFLDGILEDPEVRLCRYAPDGELEKSGWSEALHPVTRMVDPEVPILDEFVYEKFSPYETSLFARGIFLLSQWISSL